MYEIICQILHSIANGTNQCSSTLHSMSELQFESSICIHPGITCMKSNLIHLSTDL